MAKERIFNALTGEITEIEVADSTLPIEDVKPQILSSLNSMYQTTLVRGFVSSATGTAIEYKYDQNFQMIYIKWANILALDSTKDSVVFATHNGVVTMTRQQFVQFINDAQQFELNLFTKKTDLENQINNATTIDELNAIVLTLD
jgi:hypothetical protein